MASHVSWDFFMSGWRNWRNATDLKSVTHWVNTTGSNPVPDTKLNLKHMWRRRGMCFVVEYVSVEGDIYGKI